MSRQAMWLEAIEKRITATTAMLSAMKGVKMCGLTDTLSKTLQELRVDELRISRKFRKLLIWNMTFGKSPTNNCSFIVTDLLSKPTSPRLLHRSSHLLFSLSSRETVETELLLILPQSSRLCHYLLSLPSRLGLSSCRWQPSWDLLGLSIASKSSW